MFQLYPILDHKRRKFGISLMLHLYSLLDHKRRKFGISLTEYMMWLINYKLNCFTYTQSLTINEGSLASIWCFTYTHSLTINEGRLASLWQNIWCDLIQSNPDCCFTFQKLFTLMCRASLPLGLFFTVLCREEHAPFPVGWGLGLWLAPSVR